MSIQTVSRLAPKFGRRVFLAANAVVVGEVSLGDDVSVWYNKNTCLEQGLGRPLSGSENEGDS